jgi:hypothetical protein
MQGPAPDPRRAALTTAYAVVAQRRLGYDHMAWQTPALSFTAQAFLFSIALRPDASSVARFLAAGLALFVAVLSVQLLRKHHHLEYLDSLLLERIERELGFQNVPGLMHTPHVDSARRRAALDDGKHDVKAGVFARWDAPLCWTYGLFTFAAGALGVIVLTIVDASLLS